MAADLQDFWEEGRSLERRDAFRDAREKVRAAEQRMPQSLDSALDWIEQLHEVFGSPPVDREPWKGDDFRL